MFDADSPLRHYDAAEPYITADGSLIRELSHPLSSLAINQSLAEATVPVGGTTQEHYHALSEEIYYILSGRGLLRLDGEEFDVVPGDSAVIRPNVRHNITNLGDTPLVFLCCCAPAYSHHDTFLTESDHA